MQYAQLFQNLELDCAKNVPTAEISREAGTLQEKVQRKESGRLSTQYSRRKSRRDSGNLLSAVAEQRSKGEIMCFSQRKLFGKSQ
jgi:hypothetical protein